MLAHFRLILLAKVPIFDVMLISTLSIQERKMKNYWEMKNSVYILCANQIYTIAPCFQNALFLKKIKI